MTNAATIYAGMEPTAIIEFRVAAERIRNNLKRSVDDLIAAGQALAEVKAQLPHGGWLEWLRHELAMSHQTAGRLMAVAEKFSKVSSVRTLEISQGALYLLANPSLDPVVHDEAIARAEAGEKIGKREIDEIKARLRAERDKARDLRVDKEALQRQNEDLADSEVQLRREIELLQMRLAEMAQLARPDQQVKIEVNKYRASLSLLWSQTPAADRAWFLAAIRTGELAA